MKILSKHLWKAAFPIQTSPGVTLAAFSILSKQKPLGFHLPFAAFTSTGGAEAETSALDLNLEWEVWKMGGWEFPPRFSQTVLGSNRFLGLPGKNRVWRFGWLPTLKKLEAVVGVERSWCWRWCGFLCVGCLVFFSKTKLQFWLGRCKFSCCWMVCSFDIRVCLEKKKIPSLKLTVRTWKWWWNQ